jgi:hypothetical protein
MPVGDFVLQTLFLVLSVKPNSLYAFVEHKSGDLMLFILEESSNITFKSILDTGDEF